MLEDEERLGYDGEEMHPEDPAGLIFFESDQKIRAGIAVSEIHHDTSNARQRRKGIEIWSEVVVVADVTMSDVSSTRLALTNQSCLTDHFQQRCICGAVKPLPMG